MFAKQTAWSAAGVLALIASGSARADPATDPSPDVPVVEPDTPTPPHGTGSFTIGAGFGTDDGFIAKAAVAQPNVLGWGIGLRLDAQISKRDQRFDFTVHDPYVLDTEWTLDTDVYNHVHHFRAFDRRAAGAFVGLSRELTDHVHGSIGATFEHVSIDGDSVYLRDLETARTVNGTNAYNLAGLTASLEYSTLVPRRVPTQGSSIGIAAETFQHRLGSDFNFERVHAWASHHEHIGPFLLHLDGRVDAMSGDAPYTERYQFDGNAQVRGYGPGALGPHDFVTGLDLGGTLAANAHAELELPLIKKWGGISLVGFADAGALYGPEGGSTGASVGVGLVWHSPIGDLRFSYAIPLDRSDPFAHRGFIFGVGF